MNDERPPIEPEDPETGAPIEELAGLRQQPAPGFLDRIRNRIHRRTLAADAIDVSWRATAMVLMQWLLMIFDLLRGHDGTKEEERRDE